MSALRVHKSIVNAKVNLLFFTLSLFFAFFSRKIFLDCLGDDFIGLTGTLGNILGYLNLAELGIGSCISFFLYKPLQCGDRRKIEEILSVLGYLYRRIGLIILAAALIISLFFPIIFKNTPLGLPIIYFSFFSFLGSSLIGYFINYRQILLTADQKNYLVAIYFQSAGLIKTALQIFLAYHYRNLYVWVAIEFIFGIIGCIILNWKINKEYPWLQTNIRNGKSLLKQYPEIITNTKQIFIHKIKDFLLTKSDELFVFIFVSLKMVAYYGNYMLIINKIILLMNVLSDGMGAGVGNLVAEGDMKNTKKVFWELTAIRFYITGIVCFALLYFTDPLIAIWLGEEYILSKWVLYLLVFNLFIVFTKGVVQMYIHSYGLYADTWAAWTELLLNLIITIVCASYWGVIGILIGKIFSSTLISIFWKPYYLYKSGFNQPYKAYWKNMLLYYALIVISIAIFYPVVDSFILPQINDFISLVLYGGISIVFYAILYLALLYICTEGMKYFFRRIPIFNYFYKNN